jgi:hypothetical protein
MELIKKAGVKPEGHILLQFLPPDVEGRLVALEKAKAGDKLKQVLKTRFGVNTVGSGYEFYVIEQTYR